MNNNTLLRLFREQLLNQVQKIIIESNLKNYHLIANILFNFIVYQKLIKWVCTSLFTEKLCKPIFVYATYFNPIYVF